MASAEVDLIVYPDQCDAFGHLNQASFLTLFERARWQMLAQGPGMDVFTRNGAWPAVRKTSIEYHVSAFPGDVLRFQQILTYHGRTSFTMRQTAKRVSDDVLIASAEFVLVCVDSSSRPVPVPPEASRVMLELAASNEGVQRIAVNGVTLAVQSEGSGPAVLFIHGYPFDHTIWRHQVANLAGFHRIAPDLRGLGRSEAPDLGYSMATYAADLIALLDHLQIKQVVLCGHSMGGYIAFELLRVARHRVRGLILVDSRAEADSPEARRGREAAAALARDSGAAAVADQLVNGVLGRGTLASAPQTVERVREIMAGTPIAGMTGALLAMRDRADSRLLLASLGDIPTLVIAGDEDLVTPVGASGAMAQMIPGARFEVVHAAGHVPSVEQPLATTRLLAEFLERV